MGATAVMTGVMLVTKTLVDATIPRPAPKQKGPVKPRKKKSGSLRESLQVCATLQDLMPVGTQHLRCVTGIVWRQISGMQCYVAADTSVSVLAVLSNRL